MSDDTTITPAQKAEIRAFIDNSATVFTDTVSLIYEALQLTPYKNPRNPLSLKDYHSGLNPHKDYHPITNRSGYDGVELDAKMDEVDSTL